MICLPQPSEPLQVLENALWRAALFTVCAFNRRPSTCLSPCRGVSHRLACLYSANFLLQGPHCTGVPHRVLSAHVQLLSGSSAGPFTGCAAPAVANELSCASAELSPPDTLSCAAHSEDGPPEQLCGSVTASQCELCKAGKRKLCSIRALLLTAVLRAVQSCQPQI